MRLSHCPNRSDALLSPQDWFGNMPSRAPRLAQTFTKNQLSRYLVITFVSYPSLLGDPCSNDGAVDMLTGEQRLITERIERNLRSIDEDLKLLQRDAPILVDHTQVQILRTQREVRAALTVVHSVLEDEQH
jgi:hypothetical protein